MEKIYKLSHPRAGVGETKYVKERSVVIYAEHGWQAQEGFFLPKEGKPKYRYFVVDSNGIVLANYSSRERARYFKRGMEKYPLGGEEAPPYKIVRYQLVNPTHIR